MTNEAAPSAEFRGAWIPSVNNSDWPSAAGLTPEGQRREMLELLDVAHDLHLNVVILQVRPACDALYASELEPWSEYLAGAMGRAPDPYYDPLAFAVEEAHARGLQIEAWFNPYRVRTPHRLSAAAPTHVSSTHPEWVRDYGGFQWMDPGLPAVQDHTVSVILDVVRRYDVDGVHLDDYFYPYPAQDAEGREIDFPDAAAYEAWRERGGRLGRADWRRHNVDGLVRRLSEEIRRAPRRVRFGISPFGIWRPGHPPGIEGFDPFEKLYADARRWLREGWVDYLTPQLYWPTTQEAQSYERLLRWWIEQNVLGKRILAGNATYRAGTPTKPWGEGRAPWGIDEYLKQMMLTREAGADGNIHFYLGVLKRERDLAQALRDRFYTRPAAVP